jgi:hypothetical protein
MLSQHYFLKTGFFFCSLSGLPSAAEFFNSLRFLRDFGSLRDKNRMDEQRVI